MDYDVIVSGGGPVGLMLACELAARDVSVVVVERLTEPDLTIKAGAITLPASEALYRRGFGGELAEVQRKALERFLPQAGGGKSGPPPKLFAHFGGLFSIDFARLDPEGERYRINAEALTMVVAQQELERVLAVGAEKFGVEVRRGAELTGFTQDDDGVSVELSDGGQLRAAYLAGCDGGRSTVRKLAGLDFPGTEPTITGHQALVELDDPGKLPRGWSRTDVGMLVAGPMPQRILTVEFDGPPADRDAPVTAEELQTSLRHVSGTDVTVLEVISATRFTDNARQVSTYRQGRVLLAGDAAHVHSPFGGQGLNLGIGDAVNLGWKLAATLQGWAPDGLLDTYTRERHPIGAQVLETTRAQVALMRPDPLSGALRKVVADLMVTDDGNAYFAELMSGLGQRYDLGGGDPFVGERTPDLELADGRWIGDRFASGKAVLFDFADSPEVAAAADGHTARIDVISLPAKECGDLAALLVRPDGYVAWASRTPGDTAGLPEVIAEWFGDAR